MSARRLGGSRQPELFPRTKRPAITLPDNHYLPARRGSALTIAQGP